MTEENKKENMIDNVINERYKVSKVIEIVAKEEKNIANCQGKDLIIFIGGTQVGKSTTINALLGVPYQENDEGEMEPKPPAKVIAPVGSLNEGGVSCTMFPALYVSSNSQFCFLDTQGFFEVRGDQEMNIASSILMEMAINQARSVRIVNLNKYDNIKDGIAEFNRFGEILSTIVSKQDVPMFFLFNRYHPSFALIKKGFYNWDEKAREDHIKNSIKESFQRLIKAGKDTFLHATEKMYKRAIDCGAINPSEFTENTNSDDITNEFLDKYASTEDKTYSELSDDSEYKNLEKNMMYISILKNSLEKQLYGFINPTSSNSIQFFLEDINKIPEINKTDLIVSGYSTERVQFNQVFEKRLIYIIPFIKRYIFCKLYPHESIDFLIQQLNNNLISNKADLKIIEESGINEEIKQKYDNFSNQAEKRLSAVIDSLRDKINDVEQSLVDFSHREPISYWVDSWDEKTGIYYWRNHLCKYPFDIPYAYVKEELDEHTIEFKVVEKESPKYEVWFSSAGTGRRICSVVVPILIGIPISYGAMKVASHPCIGKVTIFCKPKDIEPNVIPQKENELTNLRKELEVSILTLSQLKQENQLILVQKICMMIDRQDKQLESLKKIKNYINDTLTILNQTDPNKRGLKSILEEITSYNSIIRKLYLNLSEKESIKQFITLYDRLISANPISIDLIDIESLISTFNLLP